MTEDKDKSLEAALAKIQKEYGEGSVIKYGSDQIVNIDVVPTGSIALDIALGVGGLPRGRITEIYGAESSGKSTLALHVIAEAQKAGGLAAYIDAEHALDPKYAQNIGVNMNDLLLSQPASGEEGLGICEILVKSGSIDVVVVDSVAALVPQAEIDNEMGASNIGVQARLMSQAMRKLTSSIHRSKTLVIFINQIRTNIGGYGNPETTTGGRALKFYSSVRLDVRRVESIKQGTDVVGGRTRIKVVKNKVAAPFKQAEFDLMYPEGISKEGGLIDVGLELGLVTKSGSWFNYGETRIGQGRENAKVYLKTNPGDAIRLEEEIRSEIEKLKPVSESDKS